MNGRNMLATSPRLRVLLVRMQLQDDEELAREVGRIEVTHVRDLRRACAALANVQDVVIADASLPPWDLEVLREHASRSDTPVHLVDGDSSSREIADVLFDRGARRRARAIGR